MDKATLVRSDQEIDGRVLEALSRAQIPVTLVDWTYVSEIDEWQLVISTPMYDSQGPLEAVSRVIEALQDAGIYQDVPIRRVSVLSPNDSLVKTLQQEIKARQEGTIHIIVRDRAGEETKYAVIFTPYTGTIDTVPARQIQGHGALRTFLEESLHIGRASVDGAFAELSRKSATSIFNIHLTNKDARKFGLA